MKHIIELFPSDEGRPWASTRQARIEAEACQPAFPLAPTEDYERSDVDGIDVQMYIAVRAMQSLMLMPESADWTPSKIAARAHVVAEAMISARQGHLTTDGELAW